jgi:GTPase SAR1 family protein
VIAKKVASLWEDPNIVETWNRRSEFQVCESAAYFFDKTPEMARRGYQLTEQDVLMARVRTTGRVEQTFTIHGERFHVLDVGGQRRERQKWQYCMKQVSAVVFVASLSDYELTLVEDEKTNRLEEAVGLFAEVCSMVELQGAAMILLLNKPDEFKARLQHKPLREVDASYLGPEDFDSSVEWVRKRFQHVYPHKDGSDGSSLDIHVLSATQDTAFSAFFDEVARNIITHQRGPQE